MKLIVDSGSTKTDWCFSENGEIDARIVTKGINPIVQKVEEMGSIMADELSASLNEHGVNARDIESVHFYGAGCTPQKSDSIKNLLVAQFANAKTVEVNSDLLAAARSLCLHKGGIACILGTGANSCLYNGNEIISHTPALGYILGDEGSGAVMGKKFVNGILKGWLPNYIRDKFMCDWHLSEADIIDKVYRQSSPNRFLASISKFIASCIGDCPQIESMVIDNFKKFITINIVPYLQYTKSGTTLDMNNINAVGSIAFHFRRQLEYAAMDTGFHVGKIQTSPMDGLVEYHFWGNANI